MVLSGEGADEVFGGYLYFHKAPSKEKLHVETCHKLKGTCLCASVFACVCVRVTFHTHAHAHSHTHLPMQPSASMTAYVPIRALVHGV